MTTTMTTTTTEQRAPRPVDPELVAFAAAFAEAAEATRATAATMPVGGARRRATKLATQLAAASRLIARGTHLPQPANRFRLQRAEKRPATGWLHADDSAMSIDAEIQSMRTLIVGLHEWRGHTGSLPVSDS